MFGTNVAADPSYCLQAEIQQHLGGWPARPTLLAQQRNQALVGDPEAAGIKEQEERTAGRRRDDIVENIEDVAVMRRCGNALAGILVDDRDELGSRLVLDFDEETGPGHGPVRALALSDPRIRSADAGEPSL